MENSKALMFPNKSTRNEEINKDILSAVTACLLPLTNIYFLAKQQGAHLSLETLAEKIELLNKAVHKKHQSMHKIELLTQEISNLLHAVTIVKNPALFHLPEQNDWNKLLAQEIKKLDVAIDILNEVGHQIEKPKHKKHYFGMGKIITECKTGIASLARSFRESFKRHKKESPSDTLIRKPEMYIELNRLFKEQEAKLNPMQHDNAVLFLVALTDLHDNADAHLKKIKTNYRKNPGSGELSYLNNNSRNKTPFHTECYDPNHSAYKGVSIEEAMNTFHVSMEIILQWAKDNNKVEELFKNLPGGICIDGKMRALEEWHRKVSQPELDLDMCIETCVKKYAEFRSRGQHAFLDKLKPEEQYLEDVADYICKVLEAGGEIKIKGGYNANTKEDVEKYLEDILCLEKRPGNTLNVG